MQLVEVPVHVEVVQHVEDVPDGPRHHQHGYGVSVWPPLLHLQVHYQWNDAEEL